MSCAYESITMIAFYDLTILRFYDFTISQFHDFTISRFSVYPGANLSFIVCHYSIGEAKNARNGVFYDFFIFLERLNIAEIPIFATLN